MMQAFLGTLTHDAIRDSPGLRPCEAVVAVTMAALVLAIGRFPYPILPVNQGSVHQLVERVEQASVHQVFQHAN